ncbi:leucine-rich repeat-containing protein 69-like [Biomphalaria glabrata]|uniref:Leucine-rich repeat-containing protein 69-like n=1 Tax=Biomphalaria glabrata TaxID=6526 RepID=A0A2C9L221_BIOGL|nr:leucine-rich repeat-containing protein 69-like [Biomphalaria glabrata]KAI8791005.1 leucine-rich repeat-containing protein 69 [Biomphalaria glabrata]
MADKLLLLALKSKPKKLSLCNKNLEFIPKIIGKLDCICQLQLKNNKIKTLPEEFITLYKLQSLNLGNNEFEEFDSVFQHLESLQRLHLFGNKIMSINGNLLIGLKNLTFLNLNGNKLRTLPKEICNLSSIQDLSIDNNLLTDLPVEFCALISLKEFHAAGNKLISLPLEFGYLINLEKLFLQQNKIRELPESLGKCYKLHYLDVAANELRIFPTELTNLPLTELFCEENPLLQNVPVHSVQEEEILSLKELCARFVMEELKDRLSPLRKALRYYPDVRYMLTQSSKCAVCSHAFLNTWLECVRFIDAKKDLKLGSCSGSIPVRALLCSYKCFNAAGHGFFGVAFP